MHLIYKSFSVHVLNLYDVLLISSPEPKVLIKIRPLSVTRVGDAVVAVINFSHFYLLQNHWPISSKLGTKNNGVKGIQVCLSEGSCLFL